MNMGTSDIEKAIAIDSMVMYFIARKGRKVKK